MSRDTALTELTSARLNSNPDLHADQSPPACATKAWRAPQATEILRSDFVQRIADQWDELLGCAVWLTRRTARGRIADQFASRSAKRYMLESTDLESIASDAASTNAAIGHRCPEGLSTSPSAIMDRIWESHPETGSLSISLPISDGDGHWVVTLAWRSEPGSNNTALQNAAWLELYRDELSQALEVWSVQQSGIALQSWKKRLRQLRRKPQKWVIGGIVGMIGLMCLPIPFQPKRESTLEPATRKFVSSPIEGRLKSVEVRPGDVVASGQLLGRIDDTQILRDLAMAEAELQTQNKKRDVALATRAAGDLRLAQLECQLVQLKIDSLNDQLQRLEVVSPSDGVMVQGDWYGNEGMPVSFGQTLFEIAPLDRMIARVHLKAEDLPWIQVGTRAVLRTDASLLQSWQGRLERIEPRAEIIDEEAVFVGEMEIANPDHTFRPGMKAKVAVDEGSKTIFWILFRKPLQWLQNQWVW